MTVNPNFATELLVTTLNKHRPTLTDNIWKKRVLTDRMKRAGMIREEDGGLKIVEPLIHAENDTVMTFSGYDRLDLTPQNGISASEYAWASFAGSVAIDGTTEDTNSGDKAIINLVKAKLMQLENSKSAVLNRMLWGNYTGLDSAKAIGSIVAAIDATTPFGNIDPATSGNEFWASVEQDRTADAHFTSDTHWATAFYTASNGIDGPTAGYTTVELYQAFEDTLTDRLRYTTDSEADSRFRHLVFKGVPLFYDYDCPAGTTLFPNEKNFSLVTHSKRWMSPTGWRTTPDSDAKYQLVISRGQLTCKARRGSAKLTNQTV